MFCNSIAATSTAILLILLSNSVFGQRAHYFEHYARLSRRLGNDIVLNESGNGVTYPGKGTTIVVKPTRQTNSYPSFYDLSATPFGDKEFVNTPRSFASDSVLIISGLVPNWWV